MFWNCDCCNRKSDIIPKWILFESFDRKEEIYELVNKEKKFLPVLDIKNGRKTNVPDETMKFICLECVKDTNPRQELATMTHQDLNALINFVKNNPNVESSVDLKIPYLVKIETSDLLTFVGRIALFPPKLDSIVKHEQEFKYPMALDIGDIDKISSLFFLPADSNIGYIVKHISSIVAESASISSLQKELNGKKPHYAARFENEKKEKKFYEKRFQPYNLKNILNKRR